MIISDLQARAAAGDSEAQLLLARHLEAAGRRPDAETWLRRAAASGHVEAMAALGLFLLSQPPPAPPSTIGDARRFLAEAGTRGHAAAAHLASLMLAIEPSVQGNWRQALAQLRHGAQAGHPIAQTTLTFIADRPDLGKDWQRLHEAIDLKAWMAVPDVQKISASPFIAVAKSFLSPRMCDWIVERARPKLQPARVYNGQGAASAAAGRTNSEMHFPFPEMDLAIFASLKRAGMLLGVPIQGMEPTSVLHYRPGQEFRPHHDYLDPRVPAFAAEIANAGQRVATFLIYLSDDFTDGETDFPQLGYRFKGRKGDAIFFHNVDGRGIPDPRTLHAGRAPASGEKWLLSQWIRGRGAPPPR